jgi:hypothetical protein
MIFEADGTGTAPGFADDGTSTQDSSGTSTQDGSATSTDTGAGAAAAPTPDYVNGVLTGAVGLSKVSEAAAILAGAEVAADAIEPIGAVLEVVHMVLDVWEALETPDRTCGYQGLVYGLMYASLGMADPQPNPTWPNLSDAPQHDQRFAEGVAQAKARLADGQDGVRRKNLILLAIAKNGEKATINDLWQHSISDDDHLLKMFTIDWPNVDPNG